MVRAPSLAAAALLLAACSTSMRPPVHTPLWELEGRKIHVVVMEAPPGEVHRDGGYELFHDLVTDQRDARMIDYIASVNPEIADLAETLAEELRKRGFAAAVSTSTVLPEQPAEPETIFDAIRLVRATVRSMRPTAEIDEFILVLHIRNWGVERDFAGVVPLGRHEAHFELQAMLLDSENPLFLPMWGTSARGVRSIEREWNEPPDFPKLRDGLALALDEAVKGLETAVFAWNGMPDP